MGQLAVKNKAQYITGNGIVQISHGQFHVLDGKKKGASNQRGKASISEGKTAKEKKGRKKELYKMYNFCLLVYVSVSISSLFIHPFLNSVYVFWDFVQ